MNHLEIFYAVYQEGSVTLGAERLHISQPAVSKQLKEFEGSLKTVLFDRHPKGVKPTESGNLLANYARRIFALDQEAELALAELHWRQRGLLTIGASLTIGNYILPDILSQYHKRYPAIEVVVEIGNTLAIQNKLIAGDLDIGLTEGYVDSDELEVVIFAEDELTPVAAPRHPIFAEPEVSLNRLCREDFVAREQGSGTREVIERALALRGESMRSVMSFGDIEAVKRAIAAGIGVGMVSNNAISMEIELGKLSRINVVDFKLRRPLHLLVRRSKYVSRAAQAIMPMIRTG